MHFVTNIYFSTATLSVEKGGKFKKCRRRECLPIENLHFAPFSTDKLGVFQYSIIYNIAL